MVSATHLSNQAYDICIRRNYSKCTICYSVAIQPGTPAISAQQSYGLAVSPNSAAQSAVGTECSSDYIIVSLTLLVPILV